MSSSSDLPTLNWGVLSTGTISSWFVRDLLLLRKDAQARHIIRSIGSSSLDKGQEFASRCVSSFTRDNGGNTTANFGVDVNVYGSYAELYADPDVDIVYVGTPHAFHKQNCLDAIRAGKHVLCEKAFTLNAREAREIFAAAEGARHHKTGQKVFVMEAMWTRFYPLVQTLQRLLYEDKVIGDVERCFCDFGLAMDVAGLGMDSRLKNPALGAGSLLDIGIYSLTWGIVVLEPPLSITTSGGGEGINVHQERPMPRVRADQILNEDGVDTMTTMILTYPSSPSTGLPGRQAILTSTTTYKTRDEFCRIEGRRGYITVHGPGASAPVYFIVHDEGNEERKQAQRRKHWNPTASTTAAAAGGGNVGAAAATEGENEKNEDGDEGEPPHPRERWDFRDAHPPRARGGASVGKGFYWEADAVAVDIAAGRRENRDIMPWSETVRVMEIMDEVRRQGGARFPVDE